MNRTPIDMVRLMRVQANLPVKVCGNAILAATSLMSGGMAQNPI